VGFPTKGADVEVLVLGVVAVCTVTFDVPIDTDVTVVRGAQRFVGELCPSQFPIIEFDWGVVLFM